MGGGPQGQPPYTVLQSDKTVKTETFSAQNCELFIRVCIPNQNQIALCIKRMYYKCNFTWHDSFGLDRGGIVAPML